jgi:hypothetical protein
VGVDVGTDVDVEVIVGDGVNDPVGKGVIIALSLVTSMSDGAAPGSSSVSFGSEASEF